MNFFNAQDQARRTSRRLVFAYIAATVAIVLGITAVVGFALFSFSQSGYGHTPGQFAREQAGLLLGTAVLATLFILGSSLYKTSVLSAGGGRVAVDMGGTLVPTDVQDPLRRRLRNVVEEMSIASGVPVPEIYVLEEEDGINAFAAGYSPSDAAIAVTRGTLEVLSRDELQGVIAHEFSHILNGDMKLNIRLMGVLFGIMVLGLIGRLIVRGGYRASFISSRRNRGAPAVLIVGVGLVVLGGIGVFFARLIKAGISRQREFLADASAVQFTRQSEGIANALKKIGGYSAGSKLNATDPEEISHMLFGSGSGLFGMFATHPPLIERIRALDPSFKESDYPHIDQRHRSAGMEAAATTAGGVAAPFAGPGEGTGGLTESIAATVGQPEQAHVEFAGNLRRSIPETLYAAAHSADFAYLLAVALVIDKSGRNAERQFALVQEQLGTERAGLVRRYCDELLAAGTEYRLPLLEIAFPALKLRPRAELGYLVELTTRLIEVDNEVDLYEFCFYRIMLSNLGRAIDPRGRHEAVKARSADLKVAAIDLLRVIADYGHAEEAERKAAFESGVATLGVWAHGKTHETDRTLSVSILNHSLDVLLGLNSKGQESLLRAITATVMHDRKLTVAEAELIRAVCATLNYPLPPILMR